MMGVLRHRRVSGMTEGALVTHSERRGFQHLRTERRVSSSGREVLFVLFCRDGSDSVWWVRLTHNGWMSEGITVKENVDLELDSQTGV